MKTNLLPTCIVALLGAAAALAQSLTTLKANVPFDFIVGNRTLPAGQYTVDSGVAFGALMIRSADGKGAAIALARPLYSTVARNEGSLVFHRSDTRISCRRSGALAITGASCPPPGESANWPRGYRRPRTQPSLPYVSRAVQLNLQEV
jgi:hypothetical protein